VQGERPPRSWFYDIMSRSILIDRICRPVLKRLQARIDLFFQRRFERHAAAQFPGGCDKTRSAAAVIAAIVLGLLLIYGAFRAGKLLVLLPLTSWEGISLGLLATLLRVMLALAVSLLWTIPVGVVIGTNRKAADVLQPIVQIAAAIPATALFPVLLLILLHAPAGLNLASTILMLMGTQWYLLFNIIAGASAIPQDLRDTTDLLRLSKIDRWRTLLLPALFPYIVTGSITSSGGAWNASIVAEHVVFGGHTYATIGIGALIANATEHANYPLLLGSTLVLVAAVVILNRRFWRRLYRISEEKYRME
jgi:NitT/TauT family transport system permease protein